MCVDKQSGECLAGGEIHNHTWTYTKFTGPKQSVDSTLWRAQGIGIRDDGKCFERGVTGWTPEEINDQASECMRILDYELRCCTCNGRDGHENENGKS